MSLTEHRYMDIFWEYRYVKSHMQGVYTVQKNPVKLKNYFTSCRVGYRRQEIKSGVLHISQLFCWSILHCPSAIQTGRTNKQPNKQTINRGNKEAQLLYLLHTVGDSFNACCHIASLSCRAGRHSLATTCLLVEHDHDVMENGVLVSIY